MSENEKIETILSALYKRTNRTPIPFNKEHEFMRSIGLVDSNKWSVMCHHMESEGYVNYVKSSGLQLTEKGYQFIKSGGFGKKAEPAPPKEFEFKEVVVECISVKLSFASKLKILLGGKKVCHTPLYNITIS